MNGVLLRSGQKLRGYNEEVRTEVGTISSGNSRKVTWLDHRWRHWACEDCM